MQPIEFKGHNVVFAKDQPEFLPVPALRLPDGEVISCWELTEEEIAEVVKNKCIYISQSTYNRALQPLRPMTALSDGIEFVNE